MCKQQNCLLFCSLVQIHQVLDSTSSTSLRLKQEAEDECDTSQISVSPQNAHKATVAVKPVLFLSPLPHNLRDM